MYNLKLSRNGMVNFQPQQVELFLSLILQNSMSLFNSGTTIKARVMKAINEKIEEAETEYKVGCDDIDKEADNKKIALADNLVNTILGKIL